MFSLKTVVYSDMTDEYFCSNRNNGQLTFCIPKLVTVTQRNLINEVNKCDILARLFFHKNIFILSFENLAI